MLTIKSFEFSPIQENTYVVYNEFNNCMILDPGCYDALEQEELFKFIAQNKLTPKLLVNTHCHLDHVFGNKAVAEKYNLTLHLHKKEEVVLAYAPTSGLMYGMPFDNYSGDFIFIDETQKLKLDEEHFDIFFTPGHSPGSLSFYNKANNLVLSGDVLFKNSVGRSDLPGGNHEVLIASIKAKLLVLPDNTVVYSGHGPKTTIGAEKVNNPFLL
jgi:hydroxyacylglutathione hydrolase